MIIFKITILTCALTIMFLGVMNLIVKGNISLQMKIVSGKAPNWWNNCACVFLVMGILDSVGLIASLIWFLFFR